MTQRGRVIGAALGLLLIAMVLAACGATPVAQNWPGLTVAGGNVYVISGTPQQVYILDAQTGTQKATFMPEGEFKGVLYWSPVTVAGDLALVGFAESQARIAGLYAFDPQTGQELWHVPAENLILSAPTYADGVVYFGDSAGNLYAVDAEAKQVKPGWPFQAQNAIWASPIVADRHVYVAAMDHYVYCLDAETGQEIWKTRVGAAMAASPVLKDGILYVGAYDGRVHAIHANSGQFVEGFEFTIQVGDGVRESAENWIWSTPLVTDDRLYVTSLDGRLYTLDPSNGVEISKYPSGEIEGRADPIRASPVQAGESVVVAMESGRVVALEEAQQRWVWSSSTPQVSIYTTPVVSDGTIYVVLMDGQVQTLDADNGVAGWSFSPPASE